MDPISAVGIAAAVVGFVDFTWSIIKDYGELRSNGQTVTHSSFEKATSDLVSLCNELRSRQQPSSNSPGVIDHADATDSRNEHDKASHLMRSYSF